MKKSNKDQRIAKPQTVEEKKKNQLLYNKKRTLVRSMLRNYFKELDITKEQWKWLGGKLKIKVGTRSETFSIYKNEISNKNKLAKMPLSFLTNDAMRQLAACDSEMRKAAEYQEKSIAELL